MFFASKPTGVKCVCGGEIIMLFGSRHISETGPPVFGPGSRDQYKSVEHCYCELCGLVYEPSIIRKKMPPEAEARTKIGIDATLIKQVEDLLPEK